MRVEFTNRGRSLSLTLIAVNRDRSNPAPLQVTRDAVCSVFRSREDHRFRMACRVEETDQRLCLILSLNETDGLHYKLGRQRDSCGLYLERLLHPLGRQFANRLRHRGREHQRLPPLWHVRHDLAQVGNETHIQHPIRFVENQDFHRRQLDESLLDQIQQPSRRSHEHVDPGLQGANLGPLPNAAKNDRVTDPGVFAVRCQAVANLGGKFARRRQNRARIAP